MKQIVQYPKKGMLKIENVPSPALRPGGVIVRNVCSLISAGTERSMIELAEKSLVSKARSRPDLVRQVIERVKTEGFASTVNKVRSRLQAPIPLGYSSSGIIEEVSQELNELVVGERVACAGFGYACHAEKVFVPKNLVCRLPENVSFRDGSFVTLGAIAVQGVRQADVQLGETVAVIGLGLLGQLTVQILKAAGCRVVGLDPDHSKLDMARDCGIDLALDNTSSDYARSVEHFTRGTGSDRVIITAATSSSGLLRQAADIARDRGQITVVGAVGMDIERKPFYDKELSLNLSRSYGPGRYDRQYEEMGIDYPIGYVRWTERRNMSCFLDLISQGKINLNRLVTHCFDAAEAQSAFAVVMGKTPERHLGIVLSYGATESTAGPAKITLRTRVSRPSSNELVLGAYGAGGFATGVLFPILSKHKSIVARSLGAPNGLKSVSTARQFGFECATSSYDEIISDPEIGAVMILTPHNMHAEQAVRALDAGKWVFVEKPLATVVEDLDRIVGASKRNEAQLMVGFNRRYAPASKVVKDRLKKVPYPSLFQLRINAGYVPKDSALQDDKIGKGRIIGEVCHFIDLMAFMSDSKPTEVFAQCAENGEGHYLVTDNVQILVRFADGSSGSITYAANGGTGMPKEELEVFAGGMSFLIDDFKSAVMFADGKATKLHSGTQDKGHKSEIDYFVNRYLAGGDMTSELEDAVSVTRATFAVHESIATGRPIAVEPL
jgi:predicted dehydrogenase/threonine dehydrogenase-like Zn-dependent dehydrogenase